MAGWDEGRVYYSDPISRENEDNARTNELRLFGEFLRDRRENGSFHYRCVILFLVALLLICVHRDQLRRHYNLGEYWLEVDLDQLNADKDVAFDALQKNPGDCMPLVCVKRPPTVLRLGPSELF
jgi:DNA replication licensing factor MCM5